MQLSDIVEEFVNEYPSLPYENQPKYCLHVFKTWYYARYVVNAGVE